MFSQTEWGNNAHFFQSNEPINVIDSYKLNSGLQISGIRSFDDNKIQRKTVEVGRQLPASRHKDKDSNEQPDPFTSQENSYYQGSMYFFLCVSHCPPSLKSH